MKTTFSKTAALCLVAALAGAAQAQDALPGDIDGDAVPDVIDNCAEEANEDQRDTDGDGFGNACDADFDGDGVVDESDERLLAEQMATRAVTVAALRRRRDFDLDGDGRVDERDVARLRAAFGRAPGPVLDSDRDGVRDAVDLCPATLRGARAVAPGCSALDVVMGADRLAGPSRARIDEVATALEPNREAEAATGWLRLAGEGVTDAAARARGGDPCGAGPSITGALEDLRAASGALARLEAAARAEASRLAGTEDVEELDVRAMGFAAWRGRVDDAGGEVRAFGAALQASCEAGRPVARRVGVVSRTLDGERMIALDGRVTFGLAEGLRADAGAVFAGKTVALAGYEYGDGTGLATSVEAGGSAGVPAAVGLAPCVALRFAPVQAAAFFREGPPLLDDPRAYRHDDGVHLVEHGMGVAAAASKCYATGAVDSLAIDIEYVAAKTGATVGPTPLAFDLAPGDEPVLLPAGVMPESDATLTVRTRRCNPAQPSDPCTILSTRSYPLRVAAQGSIATAKYAATKFDVDDQIPGDMRFTSVTKVVSGPGPDWALDAGQSIGFLAEGYVPFFDGAILLSLPLGGAFALRNNDFFPVHPSSWNQAIVASLASGVSHAAGLRWPYAVGKKNGQTFHYAAALPKVVRDAVGFCPGQGVDAYYRLPFAAGESWYQGQGSLSGGSHGNGYAYDMGNGVCGDEMRAARAGVVFDLDEAKAVQYVDGCPAGCEDPDNLGPSCDPSCDGHGCSPDWQPANVLWIRHQDGSFGQYVHFPEDGILPQKGEVVRRGELVGSMGTTGRSTGPHLHIAEKTDPSGQGCTFSGTVGGGCTRLMRYERVVDGSVVECYEPTDGDTMTSSNKAL